MRRPHRLVPMVGLAAATVVVGAVLVTMGSSTTAASMSTRAPTSVTTSGQSAPTTTASAGAVARSAPMATVRAASATVGGVTETILVSGSGLPLYFYEPDTATTSRVTGELAALWPPLLANGPTARGAAGTLATVTTASGRQVTYNGHFLYTFAEDSPGIVTGQGVQNFFVATPTTPTITSATPSGTPPTPTPSVSVPGY